MAAVAMVTSRACTSTMGDEEVRARGVSAREVDEDISPILQKYMVTGWGEPLYFHQRQVANMDARASRRRNVAARYRGSTVLIPNGRERCRSNDTQYRFRPNSGFVYLVGDGEPGDVLALEWDQASGANATLYTEPIPLWTGSDVISDRERGALWARPHIGLAGASARYGVNAADIGSMMGDLQGRPNIVLLRGVDDLLDAGVDSSAAVSADLSTCLSDMRLIKDQWEIEEIERACWFTATAFQRVVDRLGSFRTERDVEICFDADARTVGEGPGYPTIVACGPNATIRHYTRNLSELDPSQLLLIDGGVETVEYYTADVTRTLPIGGKFAPGQAAIYDVVFSAHQAAMNVVKPGVPFRAPHEAAMRALSEGLSKLGILEVSPEEAVRRDRRFYRRYCRHGTSHMLGIDVHDCADASPGAYRDGVLREGMVLTVEPGAYVQRHDLLAPELYRGIGVRIEDDVVVTADGCRVLSGTLPVRRDDVEKWVRGELRVEGAG